MSNKPPDPVFVLRGASQPISSVDFIQTNTLTAKTKYLAAGTQEGFVSVWDLKVRSMKLQWIAHNSSVLWLKHAKPTHLWTYGRNEQIILWDIGEHSPKEKIKIPVEEYLGFSCCDVVNFNNQTLLIFPGPSQEGLTLWNVNSNVKICCLIPPEAKSFGCIMHCQWILSGEALMVLAAYENGNISLWDCANRKILNSVNCSDNPVSLKLSQSLMKGVCGTASNRVIAFNIEERTSFLNIEKEYKITNSGIGCVSSRPDDKIYALGGWDNRVRIFSWNKHKPLAVLMYHKNSINCISFSPGSVEDFSEGYLLAAGSCDNSISLWNIFNN